MKQFIIFLVITALFAACEILEPYDTLHYFDVEVEGYAYYQDKPVPYIKVTTWNEFKDKGYATKNTIQDHFIADENGFFRVKFIRRTGREDVINHSFAFDSDTLYYNGNGKINSESGITINTADLRNAYKNIQLGRINLQRYTYK